MASAIVTEDPRVLWYDMGQQIALDIARGLSFLHSQNVLHGMPPHACRLHLFSPFPDTWTQPLSRMLPSCYAFSTCS